MNIVNKNKGTTTNRNNWSESTNNPFWTNNGFWNPTGFNQSTMGPWMTPNHMMGGWPITPWQTGTPMAFNGTNPWTGNKFNGFNTNGRVGSTETQWVPKANMWEDAKFYTIELSVNGYTKNQCKVKIDNHVLWVTGKKTTKSTTRTKLNWTRREFNTGTFSRSFNLPPNCDWNKITAKCTDGIITITIQKKTNGTSTDIKIS